MGIFFGINMWAVGMFVACAPIAFVGGFLMGLPDPIVMGAVGLSLFIMDLVWRVRRRERKAWLTSAVVGGYVVVVPVWVLGIFVVLLNIFNSLIA
jgi:hypothetical protein